MQRLRAADEAHAREPVAPGVERLVRGFQELGMAREPEVVVRAEVQHRLGAAKDADHRPLLAEDRPLLLEEPLLVDQLQLALEEAPEARVHRRNLAW